MFDRFNALIGNDNVSKLSDLNILIIGIGGVGGHAVTALARCGINNFIIADFDVVDITNINRQIIAYTSTVGKKKVDAMEEMLLDINPNCKVEKVDYRITPDNLSEVLNNRKID